MVIGDSASGKSTFARSLGLKLSLPVIHLDEIMDSFGREDKNSITTYVQGEVVKDNWIIDGNAFTKDKEERILAADLIIAFDFNPFISLFNHIKRYVKLKIGVQKVRIGSSNTSLNLKYFIPYIFVKFPKRKQSSISFAESLGKEVLIFKNRMGALQYLESN